MRNNGTELLNVVSIDFCDLHHVPVVPLTVLADVVVHGVPMLFCRWCSCSTLCVGFCACEIGSGPNVHLFDGWVCATQLVNHGIRIIYHNVLFSL